MFRSCMLVHKVMPGSGWAARSGLVTIVSFGCLNIASRVSVSHRVHDYKEENNHFIMAKSMGKF